MDFQTYDNQVEECLQYYNCKHLYYVYCIVCGMQRDEDRFIHAISLSFNEIKYVVRNKIVDRIFVLEYILLGT